MRLIGHTIIFAWLAFPTIWGLAAVGLLSPHQETAVLTLTDLLAKAGCTLSLQYGQMASHIWEARTEHENILQTSTAIAEGFKLFTQCIGHDLRTPM